LDHRRWRLALCSSDPGRARQTGVARDWSSDVCSSGLGHRLTEGRGPGPRDRLTVRVPKRREHVSAVPVPLDRGIVYLGSATRGHEGVRHEFSMLLHFVSIPLSIQALDFNELVNEFLDLHVEGLRRNDGVMDELLCPIDVVEMVH